MSPPDQSMSKVQEHKNVQISVQVILNGENGSMSIEANGAMLPR